jgi:hypothetical protein
VVFNESISIEIGIVCRKSHQQCMAGIFHIACDSLLLTWCYINWLHLVMIQGLFVHLTLSGRLTYFSFYGRVQLIAGWLTSLVAFTVHLAVICMMFSRVFLWEVAYVFVTVPHVYVWMLYTNIIILNFASQVSYWHAIYIVYSVKIYFTFILFLISLLIKKEQYKCDFLLIYITRHAVGTWWPRLTDVQVHTCSHLEWVKQTHKRNTGWGLKFDDASGQCIYKNFEA